MQIISEEILCDDTTSQINVKSVDCQTKFHDSIGQINNKSDKLVNFE